MTSESDPAPNDLLLRDALAAHYIAHGLPPNGGANDSWFRVQLGPIRLRLPNPPARRRALLFHDVNHIATGYNTTFSQGEVAIAAFEVGAGCGRFAIVWLINLWGMALGLLCAPRAVFAAFVRGRRSGSIYHDAPALERLATTSVREIRDRLQLNQPAGSARMADVVGFAWWGLVGWALLVLPSAAILAGLWFGVRALLR